MSDKRETNPRAALRKAAGISLYIQIREALREQIADGSLEPGQKLPSEDELAICYGVSRMTVRQSISDLSNEGLLYRRPGVGTFVAQTPAMRDTTRLTGSFESAGLSGSETGVQILSCEVVPAKPKVIKALALQEEEFVIRVRTLRSVDGVPVAVHDAHTPYRLFPQLLEEDLASRHLWEFAESYGCKVQRAEQRLDARQAGDEIARLLGIERKAPIFYTERTIFSIDGTPIEVAFCYNRGDRYSLTVVLFR